MFLVSGASGNVGSEVVGALLNAGEPVRALIRSGGRELPDGAAAAVGDLKRPRQPAGSARRRLGRVPARRLHDMPGVLAEVAGAGARRVVLLSGGGAAASDLDNAISRYQLESERVVREAGVPWTILRSYAFMSNALRWLPQLREGDACDSPSPTSPRRSSTRPTSAPSPRALISGDHAERTYALSGPRALPAAEQAGILGRALGRPLRVEPLSDDEARVEMEASMPVEYVDAFFSFYAGGAIDESQPLATVERVTGRAPATFEEWVARHVGMFA